MNTCTCTYHPLTQDLTDEQVLKLCHQLIGNYDDGGICVWLLITNDKYQSICISQRRESLRVSRTIYDFVVENLEIKNVIPSYMRKISDITGFGFVFDTSATLREVLEELEEMAIFAYCHDFVLVVEPLAKTKNDMLLGDSSISELM